MLTAELYNASPMGAGSWIAAGLAAWCIARIVPAGRTRLWVAELALAVVSASLLGLAATAGDFGGWREPDWRAALFTFFGAFAVLGVFRLVTIFRARPLQ
jgi:hypothetical protein